MARSRWNCECATYLFSTCFLAIFAMSLSWSFSFYAGHALHNFIIPCDGFGNSLASIMDADWRVRQAAQHLKTLFSKEARVINVIDAISNDLGPLSLDSIKKNNLSASWALVGDESSDDTFSELVLDAPDMQKERETNERDQISGVDHEDTSDLPDVEKERQTNEHDQLSGGDLNDTSGSLMMHIRRQQRVKRREERAADLIKEDVEVIEKIEDAAIEQSKSFVAVALGKDSRELDNEKADSTSRLMRDQMIMARVYLSIAKMKNRTDLHEELQHKIEERERAVGKTASYAHLQQRASEKIKAMGELLLKAREHLYDCKLIITKLRSMIQSVDDQVRSSKQQSIFLTQVAAKAMPDGIHCLTMKLTIDYYLLPQEERKFRWSLNLENPDLYHYALFSDNVLAASVVVNSTIQNAKEPKKHVFHLVTDSLNFGAMNMWFLLNPPGKATIHVENIDSFKWLNPSYCPVLRQQKSAAMKEYYLKADHPTTVGAGQSNFNFKNPKYLSMMNHLRFYLPQIFPALDKILFLDDDVVVQKDLTDLWSVDLHGKVNGAVETCGKSFHRLDKYLNFSNPHIAQNFDPKACGWAYGMNIFDLKQWKQRNITGIYHKWQNLNEDRTLWQLGTLPPGLIAFYRLTQPLDKSWHVLALGYNQGIDTLVIENAAVIHFNGNLKPWSEVAIDKYNSYWRQYIRHDHPYLRDCKLTE